MDIARQAAAVIGRVREKKPLIHHLTNYVTVNDCANIALAIGASPVMADDPAEVEEMVSHAGALVLNIGTLNTRTIESMLIAGKKAAALGKPVVFDPVGVGATTLRTHTAQRIIQEVRPSVIRGNMSEIKILAGMNAGIRGVDSTADEQGGEAIARELSRRLGCVIAITGKTDVIAQGDKRCLIHNGHLMLTGITGSGCMTTSLVGCCCGAVDDLFAAAVAGVAVMGIAGEIAQKTLKTGEEQGTFRMRLFDAISTMQPDTLIHYGKIN
ncbi:hydroxyethylthiazole kinase [Acetonema longum]|uniref:Hydroxyethylthiazole kinase n=1 Tax=Acetonema longum DSM 6540 TaxID=1009370 RepID=F7NDN2_9FIRM|nr:hydroxyethylthiazole kinase [Acetonema longum]EGO65894.1 hydroxyethylthiazole kinase [Acetonema longum DSM 6540]